MIPKDHVMLLSYVNTQLRDTYGSLIELCRALDVQEEELCGKLKSIGYEYEPDANQFR